MYDLLSYEEDKGLVASSASQKSTIKLVKIAIAIEEIGVGVGEHQPEKKEYTDSGSRIEIGNLEGEGFSASTETDSHMLAIDHMLDKEGDGKL